MIFAMSFCLILLLQIFVYIFSIYLCIFVCAKIFGTIVLRPRFKIDVVIMIIWSIVIIINSVLTLQVLTASLPHDCEPCEIKVVFNHTWFASYLHAISTSRAEHTTSYRGGATTSFISYHQLKTWSLLSKDKQSKSWEKVWANWNCLSLVTSHVVGTKRARSI